MRPLISPSFETHGCSRTHAPQDEVPNKRNVCLCRLRDRLAVEGKTLLPGRDLDGLAVADRSGEQHLGQRILQVALNHALERARPIGRVIALIGKPVTR